MPSAVTGPVPVMEEVLADTAPAVKLTVPPLMETGLVSESVLVSAVLDFNVQLETPAPLE